MRFFLRTVAFALTGCQAALAAVVLHTADDYRAFVGGTEPCAEFQITGTVAYVLNPTQFVLDEGRGRLLIRNKADMPVCAGDRVRAAGTITHFMPGDHAARTVWNSLHAESVRPCGKGTVPPPLESSPSLVASGRHYLHEVRLVGHVEDIVPDDADPRWMIVSMREGGDTVLVPLPAGPDYADLVNARVAVTGLCMFNNGSARRQSGWSIVMRGRARVEVLATAEAETMCVPRLLADQPCGPNAIAALGPRQAVGTVLAVWSASFLLADDLGFILRVETKNGRPPPTGARVRAVGQPETDLFRINLSRAHVRILEAQSANAATPAPPLGASDIYAVQGGHLAFQMGNLGRAVAVCGRVRALPIPGVDGSRMTLSCDGIEIPVDATACPAAFDRLAPGAKVAVTGILVFESENWSPAKPLPRVTDMFVSVRSPADVVLLSAPPWWTISRLLFLTGGLVLLLCGVLFWTCSLRALAERRGRALADAAIGRAETELRIGERTRLAVELHDSIAQNLTGAVLEIRTARRGCQMLPPDVLGHLDIALKTVDATREELRNCIWDLRNRALEEADFESAIRMTLEPVCAEVPVKIRFRVPRERFSDTTAHAILSIVRELAGNAIRHGKATSVSIAGAIEGGRLLFSVKDNGCGFDPESCPGQEQGHFGLQGVRERAKAFGGTVRIVSGREGTRVSITVSMPTITIS